MHILIQSYIRNDVRLQPAITSAIPIAILIQKKLFIFFYFSKKLTTFGLFNNKKYELLHRLLYFIRAVSNNLPR